MMDLNHILSNVLRSIILILTQVLVLRYAAFSIGEVAQVHFLIYPLIILLLPIQFSKSLILLWAFICGLCIDYFYGTLGVHTSALLFMAYIRYLVIMIIEPYAGYKLNEVPSLYNMGLGWFTSYVSICLFIHLFWFFSVEAFSFVYFFNIFMSTVISFVTSVICIFLLSVLFKFKK